MTTKKRADSGLTLIEILVALALTGIVLTAIYTAFQSQHKTYITQESVAEMQQNLRAAMFLMVREIRMAGYDPRGTADAGIDSASSTTSITFTEDIRGTDVDDPPDGDTGDPNENITYAIDAGNLERNASIAAENISALDFVYLDEDDNPVDPAVAASDIRSVEITMVARSGRIDPDYNNTFEAFNLRDPDPIFGPVTDGYHRRTLSTQVKCRNLGL